MKIHWGRILNAGLIAEILRIGLDQIFDALYSRVHPTFILVSSFVFMLVGAMWVARKIESRFILHGFLVGVIAMVYYEIRSLPDVLGSQDPMNHYLAALVGHSPKLLGGMLGGYLAGRRKKKTIFHSEK